MAMLFMSPLMCSVHMRYGVFNRLAESLQTELTAKLGPETPIVTFFHPPSMLIRRPMLPINTQAITCTPHYLLLKY
jgi:hypothetical protein